MRYRGDCYPWRNQGRRARGNGCEFVHVTEEAQPIQRKRNTTGRDRSPSTNRSRSPGKARTQHAASTSQDAHQGQRWRVVALADLSFLIFKVAVVR